MALTQAQIDALIIQRDTLLGTITGIKRVQQDGQTVEYQELAAAMSAYDFIDRQIVAALGGPKNRVTYARMAPRWARPRSW